MRLTYADITRVAAGLSEHATCLAQDAERVRTAAKDYESTRDSGIPGVLTLRATNYNRIAQLFAQAIAVQITRGDDLTVNYAATLGRLPAPTTAGDEYTWNLTDSAIRQRGFTFAADYLRGTTLAMKGIDPHHVAAVQEYFMQRFEAMSKGGK